MQITPDQMYAEAGRMALEIRFKDQVIAALEAENKALREQLSEPDPEPPAASAQTQEPAPGSPAPLCSRSIAASRWRYRSQRRKRGDHSRETPLTPRWMTWGTGRLLAPTAFAR